MSEKVPADRIEEIVGHKRGQWNHWGRFVDGRFYILHSAGCLAVFPDLRECPFSGALDGGVHLADFDGLMDQPIILGIDPYGRLVPADVARYLAQYGEGESI